MRPCQPPGAIEQDTGCDEVTEPGPAGTEQVERSGSRRRSRVGNAKQADTWRRRIERRGLDVGKRKIALETGNDGSGLPVGAGMDAAKETLGIEARDVKGRKFAGEKRVVDVRLGVMTPSVTAMAADIEAAPVPGRHNRRWRDRK